MNDNQKTNLEHLPKKLSEELLEDLIKEPLLITDISDINLLVNHLRAIERLAYLEKSKLWDLTLLVRLEIYLRDGDIINTEIGFSDIKTEYWGSMKSLPIKPYSEKRFYNVSFYPFDKSYDIKDILGIQVKK